MSIYISGGDWVGQYYNVVSDDGDKVRYKRNTNNDKIEYTRSSLTWTDAAGGRPAYLSADDGILGSSVVNPINLYGYGGESSRPLAFSFENPFYEPPPPTDTGTPPIVLNAVPSNTPANTPRGRRGSLNFW